MMVEILLGRRGRQSPINTMKTLAKEEGTTRAWSWIGWSGVIAGFLILSFYSVIAGWALAYVFKAAGGAFNGITAEQVGEVFGGHVGSWPLVLLWHTVFMAVTIFIFCSGVVREKTQTPLRKISQSSRWGSRSSSSPVIMSASLPP